MLRRLTQLIALVRVRASAWQGEPGTAGLPVVPTRLSYPQPHQQSGERANKKLCWLRRLIYPLTLLAICLTILTVPQSTWKTGEDSSWGGVLTYVHEKHLQFGTDVAFTYGPLGFL